MTLVTNREILAALPDRWKAQYAPAWITLHNGKQSKDIHNQICAAKGDLKQLTAIFDGLSDWTHLHCSDCSRYVTRGVEFGYDGYVLCARCLVRATALSKRGKA